MLGIWISFKHIYIFYNNSYYKYDDDAALDAPPLTLVPMISLFVCINKIQKIYNVT